MFTGLILVNLFGCLFVLGDGLSWFFFFFFFLPDIFGALRYLHAPIELSCRGVGYWISRVGLLGVKPRA